jgi:hypothetical protein
MTSEVQQYMQNSAGQAYIINKYTNIKNMLLTGNANIYILINRI